MPFQRLSANPLSLLHNRRMTSLNGNLNQGGVVAALDRNVNNDLGYDTESIAIFEIDKAFTDFLLCQICFSKYSVRMTVLTKNCLYRA